MEKYVGWFYHPVMHLFRLICVKIKFHFIKEKHILDVSDRPARIFVECSVYHVTSFTGGIWRVVDKILKEFEGRADVCPIYCDFKSNFFYCENDEVVKYKPGDTILFLNCPWDFVDWFGLYLKAVKKLGVKFYSFIYDIFPVTFAEYSCVKQKLFCDYIEFALQSDGIITDSNFVINDVKAYVKQHPEIQVNPELTYDYVHLGSDFAGQEFFDENTKKAEAKNFLMVSTVEPRKKYDQAIKAFDILWKKGYDVSLTIVGRPGWKNKETIAMIENHPELNRRLFWRNSGISDEELQTEYKKADAVIFASVAEGVGLSIYEAAFYKKPLILRDIEVFREVSGENAFYFEGLSEETLAERLEVWLELYKNGMHPLPDIKILSWKECADKLYGIVTR